MTTTEQRRDITERLREREFRGRFANIYKQEAAEAADEIDSLRFELQCAQDERDAARADVQCLRAELKETV